MKQLLKLILRSLYTALVKARVESYGKDIRANRFSKVTKTTVLHNNINFNGMDISGRGRVEIGSNFHSGTECMIITSFHNYDGGDAIPYDNSYIDKDVTIEDNVWLGSRVIILGGVKIGEGAIIQAGSVVVNDIPSCAIAGGHPAKVFKYRDIEHYHDLKAAGKFN